MNKEQVNRLTHSRNDGNKSTNATFSVRVHNFVLVFIKSRESSKDDEQNSEQQYESFLLKKCKLVLAFQFPESSSKNSWQSLTTISIKSLAVNKWFIRQIRSYLQFRDCSDVASSHGLYENRPPLGYSPFTRCRRWKAKKFILRSRQLQKSRFRVNNFISLEDRPKKVSSSQGTFFISNCK